MMNHFFIKQYVTIAGISLLIIGAGYGCFLVQSDTQQVLRSLVANTRTLRAYSQQKTVFAKEVAHITTLSEKIQTLQQHTLTGATVADVIASLKKNGESVGLGQLVVTKTQQDIAQATVTIDAAGGSAALGQFFAIVQQQSYQVHITNTVFSRQSDSWRVHATIVIPLYSYEEKK